jgi:hypothetical protein
MHSPWAGARIRAVYVNRNDYGLSDQVGKTESKAAPCREIRAGDIKAPNRHLFHGTPKKDAVARLAKAELELPALAMEPGQRLGGVRTPAALVNDGLSSGPGKALEISVFEGKTEVWSEGFSGDPNRGPKCLHFYPVSKFRA